MAGKRKASKARLILLSSAALVVLGSFGAAIYMAFAFLAGSNVDKQLAELKAKGEPTTIAEITPPNVPDGENAAVIYARAFELLPYGEANPEFLRLAEFVGAEDRRRDAKEWDNARRMLTKYAGALALAEQAAAKPKCMFPTDWDKGWEAQHPHLRNLRKLAMLAAASTLVEAHDGRMAQALDSVQLGVKMADCVRGEPSLVSFMVRVSLLKTALRPLNEAMSRNDISETQARQLDGLLCQIDLIEGGVTALRGERVTAVCTIERLASQLPRPPAVSGSSKQGKPEGIDGNPASGIVKTMFRRDEALYVRRMTTYIDHAREPYRVIQRNKKLAFTSKDNVPPLAVFSSTAMPVIGQLLRSRDEAIADISASRILLALRLHRQRTGTYPSTLSELGRKLPEDPFSGKAFVYKRKGVGIVLYSIGANLSDDGGLEAKSYTGKNRPRRSRFQPRPGDLVWRLER